MADPVNWEIGYVEANSLDPDSPDFTTLLFQAGYVTLAQKHEDRPKITYSLDFPNREVRTSFNDMLIKHYLPESSSLQAHTTLQALQTKNYVALKSSLDVLLASIPHSNYRKNKIALYEGFYSSVLFAHFNALGLDIIAEDMTSKGQIDLTVHTQDATHIFEFKVVHDAKENSSNDALQQIQTKNYAEKYAVSGGKLAKHLCCLA